MSTTIQLVILLSLVLVGTLVTLLILRKQADRKSLRTFAHSARLSLVYRNASDYQLEGGFRTYPIHFEPAFPQGKVRKKDKPWTQITIGMINPNHMYFRMHKGFREIPWLTNYDQANAKEMKHELPADITIETNDMMFGGMILSEQVKARTQQVFEMSDHILICIKGEELIALMPEGPENPDKWKLSAEVMTLLTEIKDELNG
jgi:hypothetical protein